MDCLAEFEAKVLVRYTLKTATFVRFDTVRDRVVNGTFEYDDQYQSPTVPEGPAPVSCETKRIGVVFALVRSRDTPATVPVEFVWSHSTFPLECSDCDWTADIGLSPGRVFIGGTGLRLSKWIRRNGVYTITAISKERVLFTASFVRSGCEDAA
jgi:hypothetical protein